MAFQSDLYKSHNENTTQMLSPAQEEEALTVNEEGHFLCHSNDIAGAEAGAAGPCPAGKHGPPADSRPLQFWRAKCWLHAVALHVASALAL